MLEPSKPMPCSKRSSFSSVVEIEKCCHNPGRSTNLRSTISTFFSLASARTSFGFISHGLLFCLIRRLREGGTATRGGWAWFAPSEAYLKTLFITSPDWKRECWVCSSPRSSCSEVVWKLCQVWKAQKRHQRARLKATHYTGADFSVKVFARCLLKFFRQPAASQNLTKNLTCY